MGITEVLLLAWLGYGNSQSFSVTRYEDMARCEAAREAILAETWEGGPLLDRNPRVKPLALRCVAVRGEK